MSYPDDSSVFVPPVAHSCPICPHLSLTLSSSNSLLLPILDTASLASSNRQHGGVGFNTASIHPTVGVYFLIATGMILKDIIYRNHISKFPREYIGKHANGMTIHFLGGNASQTSLHRHCWKSSIIRSLRTALLWNIGITDLVHFRSQLKRNPAVKY